MRKTSNEPYIISLVVTVATSNKLWKVGLKNLRQNVLQEQFAKNS